MAMSVFRLVFCLRPLLVVCLVLAISGDVSAQSNSSTSSAPSANDAATAVEQPHGLTVVDWLLIVLYALSTVGLGWWFGRRQRNTQEYFVGGGRMNPFLIGVSLFATLLSTISYLSMPGESLGKGPVNLLGMLVKPLVFIVVGFVLLPMYMRNRVTSAYELLEQKLGLGIRLWGAVMFLSLRLVWMSLLVYLAAKAMTVMLGVDPKYIPYIVLITGAVAVIYTSMGGLQAVVITDFLQTMLLFGGALLVLGTITYDFGGLGWLPQHWQENWDTQPLFSFPKTRVTVIGTMVNLFMWYVATAGGDQVSVQRFMATQDARSARWAYAVNLCVGVVVALTLYSVGFALLAYFQKHPEHLAGMSIKENADDLFPRYISFHLPIGVSGLVVAAMFAAAMSSLDSGVNSITAVVTTDFLDRFGLKPKSEKGQVLSAKLLAFLIGGAVVFGSAYMKYIEGNITEVTNKTVNLLAVPIFALFFFALFVPRARPLGVFIGSLFGVATSATIAFSGHLVYLLHTRFDVDPAIFNVERITQTDPVTGYVSYTFEDPISFQWIGLTSFTINVLVGVAISLFLNAVWPRRDQATK